MEQPFDELPKEDNALPGLSSTTPEKKAGSWWELLKFIFVALIIVIPVRLFIAQPFIVSGHSMDPTFNDKQYLIVDEFSYHFKKPSRGEVIVFRPPQDTSKYYIKRIVGLPNETLVLEGSSVVVKNTDHPEGFALSEPYVKNISLDQRRVVTLGADEYFVMGDNRRASSDSRSWGPLPGKLITGRTFLRILPLDTFGVYPGNYKEIN